MVTLLLTVFRDLTEAIVVGFALGSVLFIHRMSNTTVIDQEVPLVPEDRADHADPDRRPYDEREASDPEIAIYRISGAFFFGAAASVGSVLDRIADQHRVLILDFAAVPFVDATAAHTIEGLAHKAARRSVKVILTGTSHDIREALFAQGIKPPLVRYQRSITAALAAESARTRS